MSYLRLRLRAASLVLLASACVTHDLSRRHSPQKPIDAIIVPGCPTEDDGTLSFCLKRRVVWAALLWERGLTRAFVTSGAATYNRYPEAVALAAGLHALGVPAEKIWLDQDARHTDENVFYSLLIARSLGFDTLAVASEAGQAKGGCTFLESWQQPCVAAGMDEDLVLARLSEPAVATRLAQVTVAPVSANTWLKVDRFEAQQEAEGIPPRPSSLALYLFKAPLSRLFGDPWYPPDPPEQQPMSFADYLRKQCGESSGLDRCRN